MRIPMNASSHVVLAILILGSTAVAQQDDAPIFRRLPVEGFAQHPVISPDGKRVAFSREQYSPVEVFTLETTTSRILCTHSGAGWGLVWLDNAHLVVRSIHEDATTHARSMGVEILDVVAGTESQAVGFAPRNRLDIPIRVREGFVAVRNRGQLTAIDARRQAPEVRSVKSSEVIWSFEGSVILAGNTRIPTPGNRNVLSLSWSPDGSLALVELLGQPSLYLFRPANGEFSSIAERGERPAWVDGERFVFMQTTDDGHDVIDADLYLGSVENDEPRNITASFSSPAMNPSAARDGTVVFNTPNGELYLLELLVTR